MPRLRVDMQRERGIRNSTWRPTHYSIDDCKPSKLRQTELAKNFENRFDAQAHFTTVARAFEPNGLKLVISRLWYFNGFCNY